MTTPPGFEAPPAAPQPHPSDFRQRFVRPLVDRKIAGVCGAIGRATGTDPVLWRVIFAVFVLAGGAGIIAYGAAWLLLPAEGDTASPIEALIGRGHSRTSAPVTVLLGLATLGAASIAFSADFRSTLLLGALVLAGFLLFGRRGAPTTAPPYSPPPPPPAYQPQPYQQAPFSPHGPFTAPPPPPPAPPIWPTQPQFIPPKPVKPPKERSMLGKLTFFAALLALGVLGILDAELTSFNIPTPGYFAAMLAVVGIGLLVGAWLGRSRGLIVLGAILSLGLAVSATAGYVSDRVGASDSTFGSITWTPQSAGVLDPMYEVKVGKGVLDLTAVDFTNQNVTIGVRTNVGDVKVLLPPNVDTTVKTSVGTGTATVFGTKYNDGANSAGSLTDLGADGKGGGTLTINLDVKLGAAEVTR